MPELETRMFGKDWGKEIVVDLSQLVVERYEEKPGVGYQRALSHKAKQIAENFDESLYGRPVITTVRGTGAGARYAVLDGQNRLAALHLMGMTEGIALLLPPMKPQERADVFHALNTLAKSLRAIDKFRAAHAKGDTAVVEIVSAMDSFNVVATEGSTGVNAIAAVGATLHVYNLGGVELFTRTLEVITESWPTDPRRFTGDIIGGVSTFLHRDHGNTSDANVIARLASIQVSDLQRQASDLRQGMGHGGGSHVYVARGIAIYVYGAKAKNGWPFDK